MNFPQGLETIDFGGEIVSEHGFTFYQCDSSLEMTDIVIPDSVTTLKSLGSMKKLETISIPEGLELPVGFFAGSGLKTYTFPEGTTSIPDYFFCGSYLDTVVIPESVTTIGDYAFAGTDIKTIVLPDSVTSLGKGVFQDCEHLSSVTLPKRMTVIPEETFQRCKSLETLTFPKGISRIGVNAFADSGLTGELTLPAGLLSIGPMAFSGTGLTKVIFPEHLENISAFAFVNVPLESLSIPASVTSIGAYAFAAYEEYGIPSKKIPYSEVTGMEGVRFLGQYAFSYSSLTSFSLPAGLTQFHQGVVCGTNITNLVLQSSTLTFIGDYSFEGTNLISLTIPDSVTHIGNGICKNCTNLTTLTLPEHAFTRVPAEFVSGCSNLQTVNIPEGVTEIGSYAFYECTNLTGITLSGSVKEIGEYAFYGCQNLQNLTIPSSLEYVYDGAFKETPIAEANFSGNLAFLGDRVFENCTNLAKVTFKEGVISIGKYAFAGCVSLTALELPDSIVSVGNYFIKDTGVTEVTLPLNLRSLPSFQGNTTIKKVVCYSENLNCVPGECFMGCSNLETCLLSSGTSIGTRAFADCVKLQSFHATSELELVAYEAFENCSSLQAFSCGGEESNLETIGSYAFSGCTSLSYATIGEKVRTIGDYAFYQCSSLAKLDLPVSMVKLGSCAFRQSGIRKLFIGGNVTDISVGTDPDSYGRKKSCFYDMPELETVVFLDRAIGVLYLEDCFMYCPKLAHIYRPSSVGRLKAVNGIDLNYAGIQYDASQDIYYGIDEEVAKTNKVPVVEGYLEALLPGYVGTVDYRYGSVNVTPELDTHYFMDIYVVLIVP